MRTDKGFIVKSDEARFGERLKMKGITVNTLDLKISSSDTNGGVAVFVQTGLTPKGGPPLHIHPLQDEWFHVLEGEYKFQVGDDTHLLSVGDTIFLPRNVKHGFVQLSEKGKMMVSYMPAGKMESFFRVTDKWTSPPTMAEVTIAFEDHDMKIVGPPLSAE
jgi:quercetin dioxygenase-like cupin family protein